MQIKEVVLDVDAPESRASIKDLVHKIEMIRQGFHRMKIQFNYRASNRVADCLEKHVIIDSRVSS